MVFSLVEKLSALLWGIPGVVMILGVGTYITVRCGFVQFRLFPRAVKDFGKRFTRRDGAFRALCTALAATVGTGNIAGVAGAIAIGGPGAVFWMWVSGLVGMATKFAESTLAVRYREVSATGENLAGPMYMIRRSMGERWHFLGYLYSFFGVAAAFGVGNATQVNAVICAMKQAAGEYGMGVSNTMPWIIGGVLSVAVVLMVSGGAKRIGEITETLIPFVSAAYILLCLAAIVIQRERLADAFGSIFLGAFSPRAVTGGAVGSALTALGTGISRGVFTNEAGMGTAAIAHGTAEVEHPVEQGLMGIMEVFIDTILICTLTALVILTSGVDIPYGTAAGAELTSQALLVSFGPWVSAMLCACLCIFAMATILGWGLYAGRCAEFLFGRMSWKVFALCQGLGVILGAVLETGFIWSLAELMNGLMAVPNLILLFRMTPELKRLTCEFQLCYNGGANSLDKEVTYERERNWRDSSAYPAGPQ